VQKLTNYFHRNTGLSKWVDLHRHDSFSHFLRIYYHLLTGLEVGNLK